MGPATTPAITVPAGRAIRRDRSFILSAVRHGLLAVCLLGALATLGGGLLTLSPTLAQWATTRIVAHYTSQPLALFRELEQAAAGPDQDIIMARARRFLDSVPLPFPADAFGEKYRTGLRLWLRAAADSGNLPELQQAGARLLAFDPNDSFLLFDYGRALAARQQGAAAAEVLARVFEIRPTSPQVLHALEALPEAGNAAQVAARKKRHYEALALAMVEPVWMSGSAVASAGNQSKAADLRLSVTAPVRISLPLEFKPTDVYLVLPRMPMLELRVTSARFVAPDGSSTTINSRPQQNLVASLDGFSRIAPPDSAGIDDPAVMGFALPPDTPGRAELVIELECRPAPEVAAAMESYRIPTATAAVR